MREGWGELVGRLALLIKLHRLWRDMQFVSFAHYCNDRLSASARAVEQRAFLERRFFEMEGLREAYKDGRISYTKALFLAGTDSPEPDEELIRHAEQHTVKELRLERDADHEARERAALDDEREARAVSFVDLRLPESIVDLLSDAVFAAERIWRAAGLGRLAGGDAIGWIAEHFLDVWKGRTGAPRGRRKEVLGRHAGYCCVPTCTLPAEHVHHVELRSRGGGDEKENLAGVCAAHHRGIHEGCVRMYGRAGSRLVHELGLRDGIPLEVFVRKE